MLTIKDNQNLIICTTIIPLLTVNNMTWTEFMLINLATCCPWHVVNVKIFLPKMKISRFTNINRIFIFQRNISSEWSMVHVAPKRIYQHWATGYIIIVLMWPTTITIYPGGPITQWCSLEDMSVIGDRQYDYTFAVNKKSSHIVSGAHYQMMSMKLAGHCQMNEIC